MMAARDLHHDAHWQTVLGKVRERIDGTPDYRVSGRIVRATGLVLEAVGLRVPLGSGCRIELTPGSRGENRLAEAEVVGFSGDRLFSAGVRTLLVQ